MQAKIQTQGRLRPLFLILLVGLASAASYGVHRAPARFDPLAGVTASDSMLPSDLRKWRASSSGLTFFDDGAVTEARLAARQGRALAALQMPLEVPVGAGAVSLELYIGAKSLKPGAEAWQTGRVQILSFSRDGHFLWFWPRDAVVVSGDRPLGAVSAVLPLDKDIGRILVRIYNGARSGILRLQSPRLVFLKESPLFAVMRGGLILVWLGLGLWVAHTVVRRVSAPLRSGAVLGVAFVALLGALIPQPAFRDTTLPIKSLSLRVADYVTGQDVPLSGAPAPARQTTPEKSGEAPSAGTRESPEPPQGRAGLPPSLRFPTPPPEYPFSFKQVGHFGMFMALGIVSFFAFPTTSFLRRAVYLTGFALATESLQFFVVTRSSTLQDLVVDMAGLAVGGILATAGARAHSGLKIRNGL